MVRRKKIRARISEQLVLKEAREKRAISIRSAAEQMGISASSLSRLARGKQDSFQMLEILCNYFECQPGDLLRLE